MHLRHRDDIVFLFDCDNTLLDNDRVHDDLDAHLRASSAPTRARAIGAFSKSCAPSWAMPTTSVPCSVSVSTCNAIHAYLKYPFAGRLYDGALDALRHCRTWGLTVIFSDGDAVFQPRKLERSGIRDAVEGRMLIYVHKERMLDEVLRSSCRCGRRSMARASATVRIDVSSRWPRSALTSITSSISR